MSKIKRGNSCFIKYTGFRENRITRLFTNIKYAYQRAKYGFCESDIWEMDEWFLRTIPAMLEHLRDTGSGFPTKVMDYVPKNELSPDRDSLFYELSLKHPDADPKKLKNIAHIEEMNSEKNNKLAADKWHSILTEMIRLFDELYSYSVQKTTAHPFSDSMSYDQYMEYCKDKAIGLFSMWFFELWD